MSELSRIGLKRVTEAARTIDVVLEPDDLVVGCGPGGLGAALGAARAATMRFGTPRGTRDR